MVPHRGWSESVEAIPNGLGAAQAPRLTTWCLVGEQTHMENSGIPVQVSDWNFT